MDWTVFCIVYALGAASIGMALCIEKAAGVPVSTRRVVAAPLLWPLALALALALAPLELWGGDHKKDA